MFKSQAHRGKWGRLILTVLLFAWAGASAQPCLMGIDVADDMPPASEHAMHGGHHEEAADADHGCDHCPPGGHQAAESCADGMNAECGAAPDASADSRVSVQKLKDGPTAEVLPGPERPDALLPEIPAQTPITRGQLKYRSGPSLSIWNCVYLN